MFFCSDYNSEVNKDNVCPALMQLETSDSHAELKYYKSSLVSGPASGVGGIIWTWGRRGSIIVYMYLTSHTGLSILLASLQSLVHNKCDKMCDAC